MMGAAKPILIEYAVRIGDKTPICEEQEFDSLPKPLIGEKQQMFVVEPSAVLRTCRPDPALRSQIRHMLFPILRQSC